MLRSGKFFRQTEKKFKVQRHLPGVPSNHQLAVLLPENTDRFHGLSAGGFGEEASQGYRLGLIKKAICSKMPLKKQKKQGYTEFIEQKTKLFSPLCQAIEAGKPKVAVKHFRKLSDDPIGRLLLSAHSQAYIEHLIQVCAKGDNDEPSPLYPKDMDCLIKRDTFSILLIDLIQTIGHLSTITLSFTLPTHHAKYEKGDGFCLLNKTAIMTYYLHHFGGARKPTPVIIGLDINRDDGLNDILCRYKDMPFVHIDVCDPRVYPYDSIRQIKNRMTKQGFSSQKFGAVHRFCRRNQSYHFIDLSAFANRDKQGLHPALTYIQDLIEQMIKSGQPITLITPTGYDACDLEAAYCANYFALTNTMMMKDAKLYQRFTMQDYASMFDWLLLKTRSSRLITGLYYSLEGGYTAKAYVPLVVELVSKAMTYVANNASNQDLSFGL